MQPSASEIAAPTRKPFHGKGRPVENLKKPDRPLAYSDELAQSVLERLFLGEPLRDICQMPGMPHQATFYAWMDSRPDLYERYARARTMQSHLVAEQGVAAALEATPETAQSSRLKFDALRWYAGKLNPKVYGDRVDHTGSIDINVGLADRLDSARKRLTALAAGKVIEGVVEAVVTAPLRLESDGVSADTIDGEKPAG